MKRIAAAAHVLVFIAAAAGMLTGTAARANHVEVMLVETEMTPMPAAPIAASKWDRRFGDYQLENFSCCGVQ